MSKFKVGDIVRGNSDCYTYTNRDMLKGKVFRVDGNIISVEAIEFCKGSNGFKDKKQGYSFSNLDANDFVLIDTVDEGMKSNSITISINPNNPEEAQKILSDAIKEYKKKMKEWTKEEIDKAEKIADEITIELAHKFVFPVFYIYKDNCSEIYLGYGHFDTLEKCNRWNGNGMYKTALHKGDVYNPTIARCVLLCKAVGRPIPKFILEK